MKKPLFLFIILLLLLASCARGDSVISVSEAPLAQPNTESAEDILFVNVETKKIHFHQDCRYLKAISDDNITQLSDTTENRSALAAMNYSSCNNCCFPDYLT